MFQFLKNNNEIFLALFGFVIFISIAAGNLAMGLSVALFLYCFCCKRNDLKLEYRKLQAEKSFYYYIIGAGTLFLAIFVSVLFCEDVIKGLKLWFERWPWRFTFFLMPVLMLKTKKQAYNILYAVYSGFGITALYMLYQYFVQGNVRANGFYGHPMMMGGLMCILLPIIFVCLIENGMLPLPRFVMVVLMGLGILALLCNGTRGAWLSCFLTFFVIILLNIKKNPKMVIAIFMSMMLIGGFLANHNGFVGRVQSVANTTTNQSNLDRLYMWRSAVAMFNENPILGVGEGQYKKNMEQKYLSPGQSEVFDHSHSIIFHMLCVDGIIGLFSMLFMFVCILGLNLKSYLKHSNPWNLTAFGGVLALFFQGFTEYNIGQSTIMKMFWLMLGVQFVLAQHFSERQKDGGRSDEKKNFAAILMLNLCFFMVAGCSKQPNINSGNNNYAKIKSILAEFSKPGLSQQIKMWDSSFMQPALELTNVIDAKPELLKDKRWLGDKLKLVKEWRQKLAEEKAFRMTDSYLYFGKEFLIQLENKLTSALENKKVDEIKYEDAILAFKNARSVILNKQEIYRFDDFQGKLYRGMTYTDIRKILNMPGSCKIYEGNNKVANKSREGILWVHKDSFLYVDFLEGKAIDWKSFTAKEGPNAKVKYNFWALQNIKIGLNVQDIDKILLVPSHFLKQTTILDAHNTKHNQEIYVWVLGDGYLCGRFIDGKLVSYDQKGFKNGFWSE